MLTVEAASRQIQKKVFLCFQYEIVNFILFFCPPHQTIFPITYRRQRILDFSNWFQSHYMSFFLFFLFGILIVELIFSRQNICLRTTKVEELITSFSYFSHEENLWHRFVVEWKHQFDFFFPIFLIHFSQVKDVKESLQSCCFKIYFFLFRLRGFLCRLTSECQERPKCRVLTYDFGTLDNYRHSVVSCVNTWFTLNILKVSSTNLKCAIKRRIQRLERLKFTILNVHQNIWTKKK